MIRPEYQRVSKKAARYLLAYIEFEEEEARQDFVQRLGEPDHLYEDRIRSMALAGLVGKLRAEAK